MRTSDMVKSKYWRAADLQGQPPVVLTISMVTEELVRAGSRQDTKCFLWFMEHAKGLQLNKTRVRTLEAAYGPDSDLWTGHRVRLAFDPTVEFGGRAVGGVSLQTPPGVVYAAKIGGAAWGGAPGAPILPPGAPPPPVWDAQRHEWIIQKPIAAPAAPPAVPPPPVWNPQTQSWDTVNPGTGEISHSLPHPAAPLAHKSPPTISERVAAGTRDEWSQGEDPAFGHPDIPF